MDILLMDKYWKDYADPKLVYTCVNADSIEIGDIVCVGNTFKELQENFLNKNTVTVVDVESYHKERRFTVSGMKSYALAYLISHTDPDDERPYTSTQELIDSFKGSMEGLYGGFPTIWVKCAKDSSLSMITEFLPTIDAVRLGSGNVVTLNTLFEEYVFVSGKKCGVIAGDYYVNDGV